MLKIEDLREGDEIIALVGTSCLTQDKVYKVYLRDFRPYIRCNGMYRGANIDHEHALIGCDSESFKKFIVEKKGWIGVDLDGTLAVYTHWQGPYHIGAPIMPMVERVKKWLADGRTVKIFTARVTALPTNEDGTPHDLAKVTIAIVQWCQEHIGQALEITNVKDWHMTELWDDRAIQVRPNTGVTLADELAAIKSAEAGRAATA